MAFNKEKVVKLVGERIRKLRISKHLTLESLAFKAEMDYTQLSRIELGKINTSVFQIFKIAAALKIPIQDIFEDIHP